MEFIRQMEITLITGEWTIFEIYVIFVWTMMLPRMIGAGIFYTLRPTEPTHLTLRYVFELTVAFGPFGWAWYAFALDQVSVEVVVATSFVAVMFAAAPLRRWIVKKAHGWTFYAKHVKKVRQTGRPEQRESVAFITIYNEDPVLLAESLKAIRASFAAAGGPFTIIGLVDGVGLPQVAAADADILVAKEYCDFVIVGNMRNKRKNLRSMYQFADERCLLKKNVIVHLIDSDTIPKSNHVATALNRPFKDPEVGGVTTMQLIWNPDSFCEHMSQIFEMARTYSSMAAMSLFGTVGCMPGRWYAVRADCLSSEVMDGLAEDTFSYFGLMRRPCTAGDDRFITNAVLKQGKRTVMAPDAVVYTDAPDNLFRMHSMWVRWGRSSQGYTLRSSWLFRPRFWFTSFVYWGDIFLSFSTVFIVLIHWPYVTIMGDGVIPLYESLVMAFMSMAMVMTIRQLPMLLHNPRYIPYMFMFGFVAIFAHICRVESFFTQHKIGEWGTRAGADGKTLEHIPFTVVKGASYDDDGNHDDDADADNDDR